MGQHLGRVLETSEAVHHKNGNIQDDRLENLQLMPMGDHTRHHCTTRTETKSCLNCGREFLRKCCLDKWKRQLFCSKDCMNAFNVAHPNRWKNQRVVGDLRE